MTKNVPQVNSEGQKELEKVKEQFDAFDKKCEDLTMDRMNTAPKADVQPQTNLSQKEIAKTGDNYLKPEKSLSCRVRFNEHFRASWEFDKEYVHFIAENKEIPGEVIEMWTKPYAGIPYEFWKIPANRPVWAPRHVAEQLKRKSYHRLKMEPEDFSQRNYVGNNGIGSDYGKFVVDSTINRLDAYPVSTRKSVFMGANGF